MTSQEFYQDCIRERAMRHSIIIGDNTAEACNVLGQMGIGMADILVIAAPHNKADDIVDQIRDFVSIWAENDTDMRYVILEEADSITWQMQGIICADMDIYEANCRLIFLAHDAARIIEPIKSRCTIVRCDDVNEAA